MKCHTCKNSIEKGDEIKLYGRPYNYFCKDECAEEYRKNLKGELVAVGHTDPNVDEKLSKMEF